MYTWRRFLVTLLSGVVLVGAAGCVSTQKRYDKAQDLELQGRFAEAADYYIRVLEREPGWEGALERLQEAGTRAVEGYLAEAEAARLEGRYDEALGVLDRLDALRAEAADVGVALQVPVTYASYRESLAESAIEALLRRGERAEQAGDWPEALQAYERAVRYTDDPVRRAAFAGLQAGVHLRWAEQDLDGERYQAGFEHAGHILDLVPPEHPLADRALVLQDEALEAGTRIVAFLPFWRTEDVARGAPAAVVQDLNDVLQYDHWSAALPFVAAADPVEMRRELRRLRYDRTVITNRQAAEIGRVVGTDYVVVGEWTAFVRKERNLKEETRRARMRGRAGTVGGSRDTTYVEQRYTLAFEATLAYRIIDPHTRRQVDQGTVEADVSGRARRGVFAGDYRDLDLSGVQLGLFEDEERQAVEELSAELVDALALRLADRVYDHLLRLIP